MRFDDLFDSERVRDIGHMSRLERGKSRPDYLMKLKQCCESVWTGEEEGDDIQKNLTIAQVCRSG